MIYCGFIFLKGVSDMPNEINEQQVAEEVEVKTVTSGKRRIREKAEIVINEEEKIMTQEEKDALLMLELRTAMNGKRILSAKLEGIEKIYGGTPIAIVYYKERRIVIPASEMLIDINEYDEQNNLEANNRYTQILSRMLGAEIDFIISGVDNETETVVASRKAAMLKKRQLYYVNEIEGKPRITAGKKVESRVIAVGDKTIRVEIFGVETTISIKNVSWEWLEDLRDNYKVGDRIYVKIMDLEVIDQKEIRVLASIKEATDNPSKSNIKKCNIQGKYIGKVTGLDKNVIYVRLNVGVNAIALAVHDRKAPSRKDEVSFVITRIDEESGLAIGIITKILKPFI